MDIQAAELAELLKLAGVQQQPEMEVEVPEIEPEIAIEPEITHIPATVPTEIPGAEDCTDCGEVELDELKQGSADTKLKNPSKNSDYKNGPVSANDALKDAMNAGFDSVEAYDSALKVAADDLRVEEAGFEEDMLKPTGGMSFDDPEMRDDHAEYSNDAARDQQARAEWDAEQEFLASIGAQMARPDGEDMQQRGQDHSYDYETNPEEFADDDMMRSGTRVEYRDEEDYITPQEESAEVPGGDLELNNGYGEQEQIDGDDFGRDNNEYTTPVKNHTRVSEDAETKEIHESLVYKYREFKKKN